MVLFIQDRIGTDNQIVKKKYLNDNLYYVK